MSDRAIARIVQKYAALVGLDASAMRSAFDETEPGQELKFLDVRGTLDDLDAPLADTARSVAELVAFDDFREQQLRAVAILEVGGVDQEMIQISF